MNKIFGFWQIAGTYGAQYSKIHLFDDDLKRTKCGIFPELEYCSRVVVLRAEDHKMYNKDKYCKRCCK